MKMELFWPNNAHKRKQNVRNIETIRSIVENKIIATTVRIIINVMFAW